MDSKEGLLKKFYETVDREKVKIETQNHGLGYFKLVDQLGTFEYGEFRNGVYKYRLSGIEPEVFTRLLRLHIQKELNLCVYLNHEANNVFVFNLDSYVEQGLEIRIFANILAADLFGLGIRPIILKSGHGYHFWCRTAASVRNERLRGFMDAVVNMAVYQTAERGINVESLQCICYPRAVTDVSIRMFGSRHTVSGRFVPVVTQIGPEDRVMNEEDSWRYFERYMNESSVKAEVFDKALDSALKLAAITGKS